MKLLIHGIYPDLHTQAVSWALKKNGHHTDVWNQANFPSQQLLSVYCNDNSTAQYWNISDFSLERYSEHYYVVWFRRPSEPMISASVAKVDHLMAFREAECQLRGMDYTIAPTAVWVNAPLANKRASNKIVQLRTATECGLNFPQTIFSNNPEHIRRYATTHEPVIYKPFYQANWIGTESAKALLTTRIAVDDLRDDAALSACPGIFQKMIEKDYELRLTIMGEIAIGEKICGYKNASAATDWRSWAQTGQVKFEQIDVPTHIVHQSKNLMKKLGILFGCLDFIIDVAGEYYFLEINPAGQFLWMEHALPELPMLQHFCSFLLSQTLPKETLGTTQVLDESISLAEFLDQQPVSVESPAAHIVTQNPFRYVDL